MTRDEEKVLRFKQQRSKEARKRAEKALTEKRFDATEFAALAAQINKEMARLKVARKHRVRVDQRGIGQKKYNE